MPAGKNAMKERPMRLAALSLLAFVLAGCATPEQTNQMPQGWAEEDRLVVAEAGFAAERAALEGESVLFQFPTAPVSPALPTGVVSTITVASCMNEERAQPTLTRMAAQPADLAILLGDNVYGSWTAQDPVLSDLRSAYWQQSRKDEFRTLVSTRPTLAVWDDHDFGVNDGGGETFSQRELARQMFVRFWNLSDTSPQNHPDGVYGAYVFGPEGQRLQLIILDTRFNRSPLLPTTERNARGRERWIPDASPERTMLGDQQWQWLEHVLREPADLRIIISSIQVVAEDHGWERWGNFPLEQQRLYDLIGETGARGVVFVSGDRHYASVNRTLAGRSAYPLYDFTASSINMPWTAGDSETLPTMVTQGYTQENYGVVRIDWAGRGLAFELRDREDVVVFSQPVQFGEIGL
jgi:alkaline phosphatase D